MSEPANEVLALWHTSRVKTPPFQAQIDPLANPFLAASSTY